MSQFQAFSLQDFVCTRPPVMPAPAVRSAMAATLKTLFDEFERGAIMQVATAYPWQSNGQAEVDTYLVLQTQAHSDLAYSVFMQNTRTKKCGYFWVVTQSDRLHRIVATRKVEQAYTC